MFKWKELCRFDVTCWCKNNKVFYHNATTLFTDIRDDVIPSGIAHVLIEALAGLDPVEDDQLPDDEDDAWQVEQGEEEDNGQQCGQLLMLIISRWEVFLYRIFVDETQKSDVGKAHHNDR